MELPSALSAENKQCIEACLLCHAHCLQTAVDHCLRMGGRHAEQAHIRLMLDCADMCRSTADFGLRGSPYFMSLCRTCADICTECSNSCKALGEGMETCAAACQECATACRRHGA